MNILIRCDLFLLVHYFLRFFFLEEILIENKETKEKYQCVGKLFDIELWFFEQIAE